MKWRQCASCSSTFRSPGFHVRLCDKCRKEAKQLEAAVKAKAEKDREKAEKQDAVLDD